MSTVSDPAATPAAADGDVLEVLSGREAHPDHKAHPGLALAVIATAQLMVVLDATIVNIALPHIQSALRFSATGLSWVLNAYTLVFGGLLLLGGRTGDLFGRRRMFIIGVLVFAVASLAGGFAPDKGFLLAMRALQGVGGAIASPTALALVTSTFEEGPARNRAFGVYAAVSGAGAALGLLLGGILTSELSWRWVFFVNAPIGLALAIAVPLVIHESETTRAGKLDIAGAVTSTGGMAALVYGFIHAATNGWSKGATLGSLAAAVVLLAAFVVVEARAEAPLMPLRLFRDRTRVGSYVVMLIVGAAVFAMFFYITQYVQLVKGFSPLRAGFAFLPVSGVIIVVAQVTSRLVARVPARFIISTGVVITGIGLAYVSHISTTSSYAGVILPALIMIAVGMGLVFVPITLTAVSGVEPRDTGIASAMLNVGQQVGGTIGLSALVTVFSSAHVPAFPVMPSHPSPAALAGFGQQFHAYQVAFTHGASLAFRAGAIFAVAGFLAAIWLIRTESGAAEVPGTFAA